jgi:hypothetical protein
MPWAQTRTSVEARNRGNVTEADEPCVQAGGAGSQFLRERSEHSRVMLVRIIFVFAALFAAQLYSIDHKSV